MLMSSSFSMSTSHRCGTQWSTFSIGSNTSVFSLPFAEFQLSDKPLAEEPDLYKIVIPMKLDLLFSHGGYDHQLPGTRLQQNLLLMLLELVDLSCFTIRYRIRP
ncbi:hypothetical protein DFP73DRAFT_596201 [Morchella snyderi]|nr:hypothetical protein DFP73DRAFT_596201 [Morchella snyderi]